MQHCEFSTAGAAVVSSPKSGTKIRSSIKYLLLCLLPLVAGCGFKIVSASDADRYCFACQTTGYAQCKTKGSEQALSITRTEAEKVLSLIEVKQVPIGKEGATATAKAGIPVHLDGYKKY